MSIEMHGRRQNPSRRALLKGAGGSLLLAGTLATVGCGDDDDDDDASPTEVGQTPDAASGGGTLRYGGALAATGDLDPHQSNYPEVLKVAGATYLTPLRRTGVSDGNVVLPGAAMEWENPDDTSLVLSLHPDIKMQNVTPLDGRPVTSEDLVFFLERIRRDEPRFLFKSLFEPIEDVIASDTTTVTLRTANPYPSLTAWLSLPQAAMIPRELDEANPSLGASAAGAGPFIMERFDYEAGATFVRNPDYFEGGPAIERIELADIKDVNSHYAAVVSHSVDICAEAYVQLTRSQFEDLKERSPDGYAFTTAPRLEWPNVRFNVAKPPFNDPRIRKALSLATDRAGYSQLVYEGSLDPAGPLPGGLTEWAIDREDLLSRPGYRTPKDEDIQEARQLLADAGAEDLSFTMLGLTGEPYSTGAQFIANNWKEALGISVELDIPDLTVYFEKTNERTFEVVHTSHQGFLDPDDFFVSHHTSSGARNYGSINDELVDSLALGISRTIDTGERKRMVDELQDHLLEQNYLLYLGNPLTHYANNPRLSGWFAEGVQGGEWRHVGKWKFLD